MSKTKHPIPDGMPQEYIEMIGQKFIMGGGLFSRKKETPDTEFEVLAIRWGTAFVYDRGRREMKHPTFELLVKNDSMQRSRWTTPFPIREINLAKQ